MSDLANGIEEGASAPDDLSTQAAFDAALARQAGTELPEGHTSSEDFSIASGLETIEEPTAPRRDELGRFAAQDDTPQEEQATPPADAEEPASDPQTDWETRYNEAQSLIGRQGNELGELRERLAKLEGAAEERARAQSEQPAQYPVVDDRVMEQIEDNIAQRGGYATMAAVVEQHPNLIEPTLELWEETGDPAAFRYRAAYEVEKRLANVPQPAAPAAPQADPYLEQVRLERMAAESANAVLAHIPSEQRDAIKPFIGAALEELPEDIARGLFEPEKRESYSKFVADIARSNYVAKATADATAGRQEDAEAAKAAARVTSGSLRPAAAPEGEGEQLSTEERTRLFHKAILETPTASISEGLTYGK